MDDLPLKPKINIIDHLSIEDILSLQLVNKSFYHIINQNTRIKHIVISTNDLPYNRRWFYTCHLLSLKNLIKYDFDYINLNKPIILAQLKQLYIYKSDITLEKLNSLDRLVHLEIMKSKIKSLVVNDILRLPMLETLNLDWSNLDRLIIDSTRLQRLKLNRYGVRLVHPKSITWLEVDRYGDCDNFLHLCINLQHLYCSRLSAAGLDEFHLIKHLAKLKSIHFDLTREEFSRLVKDKKVLTKI